MSKKILVCLAMVMVLSVVALSACGKGDETTTPTTTEPTTTQPTTTEPTTTEPTTTEPTTTEPTTTEPTTTEPTTTEPTTAEPTTAEPTTTEPNGGSLQLSAANHAGQTNDSMCAFCHPVPFPNPVDDTHEGATTGCLVDGCHTLP